VHHAVDVDQVALAGASLQQVGGKFLLVEACLRVVQHLVCQFPGGDLHPAAANVFIQGDVELFDQVIPPFLDIPGHILGKMLARFGHEVAQPFCRIKAHAVVIRHTSVFDHLPDQRVEVSAFLLKLQVKCQVVDASADIVDLIQRNIDQVCQLLRRALHGMAQAYCLDGCGAVDRPGVNCHRVDVVQQPGIRADLLHIAAHLQVDRDGA